MKPVKDYNKESPEGNENESKLKQKKVKEE